MTDEIEGLQKRLEDAREQFERLQSDGPGTLGPPDPATGEQWNRANVLGHMAEILPFWTGQIRGVIGGATRLGRDPADTAARRRAIDEGQKAEEAALRAEIEHGLDGVFTLLSEVTPAQLDLEAEHVRATETRTRRVGELVDQLLVHHFEVHVHQLQELG